MPYVDGYDRGNDVWNSDKGGFVRKATVIKGEISYSKDLSDDYKAKHPEIKPGIVTPFSNLLVTE